MKQISGGNVIAGREIKKWIGIIYNKWGDGMRNLACELLPITHGSLRIIEALFPTISLAETSRSPHSLFPSSPILIRQFSSLFTSLLKPLSSFYNALILFWPPRNVNNPRSPCLPYRHSMLPQETPPFLYICYPTLPHGLKLRHASAIKK